jgi:hypothetical protein
MSNQLANVDDAILWYDDEILQDIAQSYGHPEPNAGECNNIRQKLRAKLLACPKNASVWVDGKSVYIHSSSKESLVATFKRVPVIRDIFSVIGYDNTETRTLGDIQHFMVLLHYLHITAAAKRIVSYVYDTDRLCIKCYVRHATGCACDKCQIFQRTN